MNETRAAVQRLKHGDIGGLEILFARYQVRAVRAAFLILQDEAAAQDVVQETFLRIYRKIHHFDETQPFEPYLLKSVVHAALNAARHSTKMIPFDGDLAEIEALLDGTDSPEVQIEASQRSQQTLPAPACGHCPALLPGDERTGNVRQPAGRTRDGEVALERRSRPPARSSASGKEQPMKPTPRELLDAATRTRVPDNLNLYPRISAQLERNTWMQTLRAKPALLLLSVLLALTLLTGVAYAVGRLAGFIPGFGFTGDTSTVYVLEEPAQVEHEGATLHVENAVSAEDKFWISFSVGKKFDPEQPFHTEATVILLDGTTIRFQAAQEVDLDVGPYKASYEFPALPLGTDALTLHYEFSAMDGSESWSVDVPVELRPIRADEVIPAPEAYAALLESETYDGLTLVLDHVATASDKTILQVSLRFDQPTTSLNTGWDVILSGDDGKIFPLTEVIADSNNQSKTYETLPFRGAKP